MGTLVTSEWPELEMDQYYIVFVDAYQDMGPANDCTQDFGMRQCCCRSGGEIQWWLDHNRECQSPFEICTVSGYTAQRIVALHGPYATYEACEIDRRA